MVIGVKPHYFRLSVEFLVRGVGLKSHWNLDMVESSNDSLGDIGELPKGRFCEVIWQ
jgi:hypothetical protein